MFNLTTDPYKQHEINTEMPHIVAELSEGIEQQRLLDDSSRRADVEGPRVG